MWKYNGKNLTKKQTDALPLEHCGFIYCITNVLVGDKNYGKIYVGRKQFANKTRSKIGVKEKKLTKTRKRYKITVKESNWQDYNSSCQELIDDFKRLGANAFEKIILEFCPDKRCLSYREVWWMFYHNVLEIPSYNGNILGRFFKSKK